MTKARKPSRGTPGSKTPRPTTDKGTVSPIDSRVNNFVIISDQHAGCRFGLCPPDVRIDGGGKYRRSRLQAVVWRWWDEFWSDFVPYATRGEPFAVVVNGDAIDGRHHGSTTQISQNLADQRKLAERILAPVVDACGGQFYMVRGTPAHVGESGENEESLAKSLGAIPNSAGQYARDELWAMCGGALCHFMHHVGTASRQSYETSAVMAEIAEEYISAAKTGDRPPDFVVRSHRHKNIEVSGPSSNYRWFSFVTASWQLKTPFAYKVAGARITPPDIGGSVIRQGARHHYAEHFIRTVSRAKVEIPGR
jgi:hypothetical protein